MAILDDRTLDFISTSAAQTERLGVRLGELLEPRITVCLSGELGAGKTMMARGIGRGWGVSNRVTSPSYVIVNEYPRMRDGRILYHIDCYRLESEGDIVTAGLDDIFDSDGAIMIEWPERVESRLPEDRIWIALTYESPTRRHMRYTAQGARSEAILTEFKQSAFGV